MPKEKTFIPLVYGLVIYDRRNKKYIVDISIRQGIIADVYVHFKEPSEVDPMELCDDPSIKSSVNVFLNHLGYKGEELDRAELGMQEKSFIVLEPGKEFTKFATKRYGFKK